MSKRGFEVDQSNRLSGLLAQLVALMAWSDGHVSPEEVECVKDVVFQMPALEQDDLAKVERLLEEGPEGDTRDRLIQELAEAVQTEEQREFSLYALEQLAAADGRITEDERGFLDMVDDVLRGRDLEAISDEFGKFLTQPLFRRHATMAAQMLRPASVCELVEGATRNHYGQAAAESILGDIGDGDERDRLLLAGAMLARVFPREQAEPTRVRGAVSASCQLHWDLPREQAEALVSLATLSDLRKIDLLRLSRHFFHRTEPKQRLQFLEILFLTAESNNLFSAEDLDEIINLAANMRLSQEDFSEAFDRMLCNWEPVFAESELVAFKPRREIKA